MTNIFDRLEQIQELDLSEVTFAGNNLRMTCGQTTTFNVEDRLGYVSLPEDSMRLVRLSIADQSGKPVIRGQILVHGERIGLLGDEDAKTPLPVYSMAQFNVWRTYPHGINFEFQNPNPDAVAQLHALCVAAGFVPFAPMQRENRTPYVRAEGVQYLYDHITENNVNSSLRYNKGVPLDSIVLVPDLRVDSGVTQYQNSDGEMVKRPAFTSFFDSIVPLMEQALKAGAGTDPEEKRTAVNRLTNLTGYDPAEDFPLRPSLGYVTPKGHDEITVFPPRDDEGRITSSGLPALVGATATDAPTAPAEVSSSDEPFDK